MKNKILGFFLRNKKNKKVRLKSINKKRKNKIIVYKKLSYNINLKGIDKNYKYLKPLNNNNNNNNNRIINLKNKNKNVFVIRNYNNYESSKSYTSLSLSVFENIKDPEERMNYVMNYEGDIEEKINYIIDIT